jgi:hypothetical protein
MALFSRILPTHEKPHPNGEGNLLVIPGRRYEARSANERRERGPGIEAGST